MENVQNKGYEDGAELLAKVENDASSILCQFVLISTNPALCQQFIFTCVASDYTNVQQLVP
jgi:hypothetical protein